MRGVGSYALLWQGLDSIHHTRTIQVLIEGLPLSGMRGGYTLRYEGGTLSGIRGLPLSGMRGLHSQVHERYTLSYEGGTLSGMIGLNAQVHER